MTSTSNCQTLDQAIQQSKLAEEIAWLAVADGLTASYNVVNEQALYSEARCHTAELYAAKARCETIVSREGK